MRLFKALISAAHSVIFGLPEFITMPYYVGKVMYRRNEYIWEVGEQEFFDELETMMEEE
jgi:hypothetical protein